ncbi:hypothetical protein U9M48_044403 [Paspalum notatum var. saurae]|uniref:Cysteine-rich receptor-like protein kinase 10 n=1 Tax=Paspalum notatum var. saurae TaxID=547442 RepID=A0AAQ3UWS1_PASNO
MYDLSTLSDATDNFSQQNKLGARRQEIAVKRLSATSQQGQKEIKNEVILLAKLQHMNLVRLLGCCIEEHERLLIYEFLSNNSLDKILLAMQYLVPLLFLCSSLFTATTNADPLVPILTYCPSNTNYTRGSAFQANLNALLASLPASAAASYGFAKNATGGGAAPDQQAYGLGQCRRDVSASVCASCLEILARNLRGKCPGQKTAMDLSESCMLRHSNESFFGVVDSSVVFYYNNPENATQPKQFESQMYQLMYNLTDRAVRSPRIARGILHGSGGDYYRCLKAAIQSIPAYCNAKQGCQIFCLSCYIRFETNIFYNMDAAEAAMLASGPAPAPRGGPPNTNTTDHSAGSENTGHCCFYHTAAVAACGCLYLQEEQETTKARYGDDEQLRSSGPLQYELSTLRAATDNFSEENKLGQGGFGPVYKGTRQNGQEIAVKRLSATSHQGLVEMKNEIVLVGKLQHKNLVRLLGFCIEEEEKLLLYEFLRNKSLDKIIFGPARQQALNWGQRYKIIEGIGKGLVYLHEDSRLTVIHRDLKAGNILLDTNMNPKISDFGLARLFNIESSVANTSHIAGTCGYMAPEYAQHGIFSAKSDVFSYGVLVLEIITTRRVSEDLLNFVSCNIPMSESTCYNLSIVWGHWTNGTVPQLLDGCAEERGRQEMLRCIHIGLLCVQDDPQRRPGMASVLLMLNSPSITLSAPTEPAFMIPREQPRAAAQEPSINEASVSDLEPR